MGVRVDRVIYADDGGQEYRMRSRGDVIETDGRGSVLGKNPLNGQYSVVQCEHFEQGGQLGVRISLQLIK
jgi:hypothetical protein